MWFPVFDADAAVLMLKHKIHRIPVINSQAQVVGKYSLFFNGTELTVLCIKFFSNFFLLHSFRYCDKNRYIYRVGRGSLNMILLFEWLSSSESILSCDPWLINTVLDYQQVCLRSTVAKDSNLVNRICRIFWVTALHYTQPVPSRAFLFDHVEFASDVSESHGLWIRASMKVIYMDIVFRPASNKIWWW